MLPNCDELTPFRIVGIDPGTDTLGVSVLDVHLHDNTIELASSQTFKGSVMARGEYRHIDEYHGNKTARLKAHEDNLYRFFCQWRPHDITSESPYMSARRPSAYGALVECIGTIRSAMIRYDWMLRLHLIDPPSVKNAVGVGGKSGDKDQMYTAVNRLVNEGRIQNPHGVPVTSLDEHSIDSIAVAYQRALYVISNNVYRSPVPIR